MLNKFQRKKENITKKRNKNTMISLSSFFKYKKN